MATLTFMLYSKSAEHQWVFPAKPGNKEYEIVREWLKDGNTILDPPPKSIDKNRGDLAYREHPECHLPENESSAVWRYMDFPKFLSLLVNGALFFSRASNIIKHDDAYEGAFSKSSITGFGELSKHIKETSPQKFNPNINNYLKLGKQIFERLQREEILINCWIMKEDEDSGMWAKYGKDKLSVAIKSDIIRLKSCFGKYVDYDIFISKVKYIDYDTEKIIERSRITPFLYKRKIFNSEREVRCFLYDDGDISLFPDEEPMPVRAIDERLNLSAGVNVPVDLYILIDKIYLSSWSPKWADELIYSLLNKLSLPSKKILFSALGDRPQF